MTREDFTGKPIQCKAAVCYKVNTPMVIETITVDPPKAGEVRIKMVSSGICASDLTLYSGNFAPTQFPVVLGHEANAIVESVGEGVTDFKPGDSVYPLWNPECRDCSMCRSPYANTCEKAEIFAACVKLDGTTRMSKDGETVYCMSGFGTFCEYAVAHDFCLVKVEAGLPLEKLSPFGCCIPTGYGAAVKTAGVYPGSTVAVWGLGAVGLCVVLGAKNAGAKTIIGIDTNPDKFEIGKKFGCTDFVNPLNGKKSDVELVRELTNGGADFTFVAVGSKIVAEAALEASHKGYGKSVIIGMIHGDGIVYANPLNLINGKTWTGSLCGGYRARQGIPELLKSYANNELPEADLLITNIIKLEEINDGFEQLKQGKQLRTVIIF